MVETEINEIDEEHNFDEIESNPLNNVILKPKELGESSSRNTNFMRLGIFQQGVQLTFPLGSSHEKPHPLKRLALPQLGKWVTS